MEESSLIPYLFRIMVEEAGGIIDFDAEQVLQLIKKKDVKAACIQFVDAGTLRVEIMDQEELDESQNSA